MCSTSEDYCGACVRLLHTITNSPQYVSSTLNQTKKETVFFAICTYHNLRLKNLNHHVGYVKVPGGAEPILFVAKNSNPWSL